MSSMIKIDKLSYAYGKSEVLSDISMEVEDNSILFVMGNNGTGKTTLIKCLLNSLEFQTGNIWYNGEELSQISKARFAKLVSYVPQNININCGYKVKEYLVLGRNPYITLGNPQKKDYDLVEFYALKTGIQDILEKPFNRLSGGQKQWVAITRALVQETPVIIMDEPMSALDMGKQAELLLLLKNLKDNHHKTIVLTSHNPNHCLTLESMVCLLHHHKIHAFGSPWDVFTRENVSDIYGNYVVISENNYVEFKI